MRRSSIWLVGCESGHLNPRDRRRVRIAKLRLSLSYSLAYGGTIDIPRQHGGTPVGQGLW